jgi:acyl-CoA thioesterase FadM
MPETLQRYLVRYQDISGDGPVWSARYRAYCKEHVEDQFFDSDDQGWKILSIKRER